jgi:hypothetical protein
MATNTNAYEIAADEIAEDEIDNNWVDAYKNAEANYNEFYNEPITTVKVFFLYVNTEKTVVNIKQEYIPLTVANLLPREQLITLIKEKQLTSPQIKYKLFSLLRYNISLQPEEISDFLASTDNSAYIERFLIKESYVKDIYFTDTINIFQDLNALYIIFKAVENNPVKASNTNTHKFTKKLKASIKKRYTRYKK